MALCRKGWADTGAGFVLGGQGKDACFFIRLEDENETRLTCAEKSAGLSKLCWSGTGEARVLRDPGNKQIDEQFTLGLVSGEDCCLAGRTVKW